MRSIELALIGLVAILGFGCASVFSESEYGVEIDSWPAHLDLELTDSEGNVLHQGMTPYRATLDASSGFFKGAEYKVVLYKPRSHTTKPHEVVVAEEVIRSSVDGWFFANLLNGVGMLIDGATGSMWALKPNVFIHGENLDREFQVEVTQSNNDQMWSGPIPKSISWGIKQDETLRVSVKLLDSTGDLIGDVHLDLDKDGWSWDNIWLGEKLWLRVDPITGEMWAIKSGHSSLVMVINGYRRFNLSIRYVNSPAWFRPSAKAWKNSVLLVPERE